MFSFSSIANYHNSLLSGSTSCTEAVHFYLQNIEAEKHLNAFLEVYADEALATAAALDEEIKAGKPLRQLHGVVIGLKDVILYKNHKATAGSKILEGFTSIYNATATEKLLAAGAVIIGRQNCDEFAMGSSNENSAYGNVLHPLDNERVPGGSSGGSAVSVKANLCMASLGSDTGGSVRQPADFCGITGFKPSYGMISRYGLIAYASSFDQIGIFSNSVEDASLILEVISGKDEFDSTVADVVHYKNADADFIKPDTKKKFVYFKQFLSHPGLDKEIPATFYEYVQLLIEDGYTVDAIDFDYLDYIVPAYYILTTAEASSNLSRFDGVRFGYRSRQKADNITTFYKNNRSEGFGKEVKSRIMLGTFVLSAGYYDAYFTKAQQVRQLLMQNTKEIFSKYDAILSPTVPSTAFKIGEKSKDPIDMFLADIYTVFANLVGVPSISIPLFKHSNGLPFGLQILSAQFNDKTLLEISHHLMQLAKRGVTA